MTIRPENASDVSVYHFGLVVTSLAVAVEQYSSALGCRFARAWEILLPILVGGQARFVELLVTYSTGARRT
jgi:hypothetical protein